MSSKFKKQNDLTIKLDEIKEDGYHLSCIKNNDWINEIFKDIKDLNFIFVNGINIQIEIFKTGENIFIIKGLINTSLRMSCIRCLDDFDFSLGTEFQYNLCPSSKRELLPEMEINKRDLDLFYYQEDSIDILPLIREQVILNIPSYPLCRESCKGICPHCGLNLNQGSCQCNKRKLTNSKFEVLKNFHVKH